MNIDELLSIISDTAAKNNISTPFIVGGVPRDRILKNISKQSEIKDIDITTGDNGSIELPKILSRTIRNSNYRVYDDKHSSIDFAGIHIDFSSNFIVPGVIEEIKKKGVKDINAMKMELYSRDFTINTLLESLDFKDIYDITGDAIDDMKLGIIRCPIDPKITIGYDPRRILRAIKFSVKYGFKIDTELKNIMMKNRKTIQTLPVKFVQDKMNEIVNINSDDGVEQLIEFKLLPLVPLTKTMSDILIQKRQLVKAI